MKVVLQRVESCTLHADGKIYSSIGKGLLILVGVHRDDSESTVDYLAKKIANLRIFKDDCDKTNNSIKDENGEALVVSNFTLQAEIKSGTRPSFSNGSDEERAEKLYLLLAQKLLDNGVRKVVTGKFKSKMQLSTMLDGPFTIVLEK